jgi:uncharacterized RDD family membrane protein YckC
LWKKEVNRRVAEHNGRKPAIMNGPKPNSDAQPAGSRAAQAAARVAERYAKAPSYSQMLAEEARAAVRAAEAASRAALEAQAAAESVLAGLEAQATETQAWEPEFFTTPEPMAIVESAWTSPPEPMQSVPQVHSAALPQSSPQMSPQTFESRWDENPPVHEASPEIARANQSQINPASPAVNRWQFAPEASNLRVTERFDESDLGQPFHANLIEFPRELIATRRVRLRHAEDSEAPIEDPRQLSIFEVDPGGISIDPAATGVVAEAATTVWAEPVWSGIRLDEEPQQATSVPGLHHARYEREQAAPVAIQQSAPLNQRIMAGMVDLSLIAAVFFAGVAELSAHVRVLPAIRTIELGSALALALIGAAYMGLFFILGQRTPGMRYARLELRTFSGEQLSRPQRWARMGCLVLALMPAGLGVVLSIFDDQGLCWHDRLSGSYPRKA